MKIGIDARFLGTETGIGRYILELISHLEEIDTENQYFIFLTNENWDRYESRSANFHKVKANFPWYSWQEQVFFPFLINPPTFLRSILSFCQRFWCGGKKGGGVKKHKIDLMHFPHFNVPLFCRVPFVVTIHDLILLHYPSTRASTLGPVLFYLKYIFYRLILKHAIKNSKAILTPSKFTKKDILENFKVPENKITATYEASSLDEVKPAKKEFLSRLKITKGSSRTGVSLPPKPYFLTVGNAYPHKNLKRLFRVFKKFNKNVKRLSLQRRLSLDTINQFQLVFAGPDNYFYKRLRSYAKEIGLKRNEVIMPGKVSDEELKLLYLNALAYVFPSFYEGFGLPGLEAMVCGIPIIAADCTSLPEVYGNAAFYFNPKSDDEMLNALVRIAQDDKLRDRLRKNGFKIVKQYSWSDLAKQTLRNYENITKVRK